MCHPRYYIVIGYVSTLQNYTSQLKQISLLIYKLCLFTNSKSLPLKCTVIEVLVIVYNFVTTTTINIHENSKFPLPPLLSVLSCCTWAPPMWFLPLQFCLFQFFIQTKSNSIYSLIFHLLIIMLLRFVHVVECVNIFSPFRYCYINEPRTDPVY